MRTKQCREEAKPGGRKSRKDFLIKRKNGNSERRKDKDLIGEFDPGSGRTLAACLTHASRAGLTAVSLLTAGNLAADG